MDKVSIKVTVFFEMPFWVGVFEQISQEKLSVCKVTFKTEPKDYGSYSIMGNTIYMQHMKMCCFYILIYFLFLGIMV